MADVSQGLVFVGSGDPKFDTFPDIETGGSGPVWRLARKYTERGHDVTIFAGTYNKRHLQEESRVTIVNLPVTTVPDSLKKVLNRLTASDDLSQSPSKAVERLFGRLWFSYRVSREIESLNPDGIFLRSRFTGYFPSQLDKPVIFTVKSPDACNFFHERTVSRHPANRLLFHYKKYLEENVIQNSDCTIVLNDIFEEYFQPRGYHNIYTIPNGIEDEYIIEGSNNNKKNIVLYVGRLDENKRPGWLLDSFAEAEAGDYDLHFIGSGPKEERLKMRTKELGMSNNVAFHGRIPRRKVLQKMRMSKMFVLPSEFEVFGNVIIEAMASGTPVIASDTDGAKYLINHHETGLLFDKQEKSQLTRYLDSCIGNIELRHKLQRNALKYVKNNHRADRIADQYWSVFEKSKNKS